MNIKTCLYLVSEKDSSNIDWNKWYEFCTGISHAVQCPLNYLEFESASLHPSAIRTMDKYLPKVKESIAKKESIKYLGFYSLPKDFVQAVFDYRLYMCLTLNSLEITMEKALSQSIDTESIIKNIDLFISDYRGEVYELPHNQIFNYNANHISAQTNGNYEGLKVLKRIESNNPAK